MKKQINEIYLFMRQLHQLWNLSAIVPSSEGPVEIPRAEIRYKDFTKAIPEVSTTIY